MVGVVKGSIGLGHHMTYRHPARGLAFNIRNKRARDSRGRDGA